MGAPCTDSKMGASDSAPATMFYEKVNGVIQKVHAVPK